MAEESPKKTKKKRPKHTNLVTPGEGRNKKKKNEKPPPAPPPRTLENTASVRKKQVFDVQSAPVEEVDTAFVAGVVRDAKAGSAGQQENLPARGDNAAAEVGGPADGAQKRRPKGQTMQFPAVRPQEAEQAEPEILPPNARRMPPKEKRKSPAAVAGRRRKRLRWLRLVAVLLVVLGGVLFYTTGAYLSAASVMSDAFEGVRVMATGGDGFPAEFGISGFKQAKALGNNGFAALGEKDLLVYSSGGKEWMNIQHGYVNPSLAAGKTRVCLYNRGSTEYIITSRTQVLLKANTENDILFATLSPGGTLAIATASQFRSYIEVYGPGGYGEWRWNWSSATDTPVMGAFDGDNKTLALACLKPGGGTLSTVVYLFKTDRGAQQGAEVAAITAAGAVPVQMEFVGGRLLVLYDVGYAALYDKTGNELARYDYGGQTLSAASINEGVLALLFGSSSQENAHLVLLDTRLEKTGETTVSGAVATGVLTSRTGTYVLAGQEVLAYTPDMAFAGSEFSDVKNYGLVWGGQPLAINAGGARPLKQLVVPAVSGGQVSAGEVSSAGSVPMADGGVASGQPQTEPEG